MGGQFFIGGIGVQVKQPVTFEQQLQILQEKGFTVEDEKRCLDFLRSVNYYRLKTYLTTFRDSDGICRQGVSIDRIARIYEFDRRMRGLLFSVVEEIELYLRLQLAYYHAHRYGPLGYMEAENFGQGHNHTRFLGKVRACISSNEKSLIVEHHKRKYEGKFPLWVIVEFFSLGMLSCFYADMLLQDKKTLAVRLFRSTPRHVDSWLKCLTELRNRCAHYSRLYDWRFVSVPRLPDDIDVTQTGRLFEQVFMLGRLYPDDQKWDETVVPALDALLGTFRNDIKLSHIGFPDDWKELLLHSFSGRRLTMQELLGTDREE